ncbi:serine-rich adhesin for platelets-like [Argopecten irradians]|uniref:serine-rich adhesin for platelets-like n=1 Tax=Argopecten irradians TaxID=31199 RepID=UPI00371A804D
MYSKIVFGGLLLVLLVYYIRPVTSQQKDIVFLVDITSGATSSELDLVIDFLYKVTSFLTIGQNDMLISVVTYSSTATESFDFDDYPDRAGLLAALNNLKSTTPTGSDGLVSGLNYVIANSFQTSKGSRTLADDTLVVIAHSQSVAIFQTAAVATTLGLNEIHAYTVGIGPGVSQSEMEFVSTDPDADNNHVVNSFSVLCDVVPILVPKLDSTSSVTSADGCDVTTTSAPTTTTTLTTTTTTQPTTTATTTPAGLSSFKDIIFVVDVSSGANDTDLNYVTDFVYKVVSTLTIGDNDTLVSIITFSDTIEERFALDVHKTSSSLLSATSTLMDLTPSGDPQTFEAFSFISANAFANGRAGAPDIAVLVTYSESTSTAQTAFNALSLRTAGTSIFVVGVGDTLAADNDELIAVASSPSSYYIHYVANFTNLCDDLIPVVVPKLDSSKSANTDVCATMITSAVTQASVNTQATSTSEDEDDSGPLVVGAIIGGVCVTVLLLIGAGVLIVYCKKRNPIGSKTRIKDISQSNSSFQKGETRNSSKSDDIERKRETASAPTSGDTDNKLRSPNRHDSDLSVCSRGSVSPVITERDLPGMVVKGPGPQEGETENKEMKTSLVSISDPVNELEVRSDEGYKSNSIERTPGSAGSDQLSFSNSEKDMFRQDDFTDWRSPSVHSQLETYPTAGDFDNSEIIVRDKGNAAESLDQLTTDSREVNSLGSEPVESSNTTEDVSESEKGYASKNSQTTITYQNRESVTPTTRYRPQHSSLADAIHSNPRNSPETHQTQTQTSKKKRVLIRQGTQQSIYSRRPSMVQIDIGEI